MRMSQLNISFIEVGKVYKLDDELLKCTKVRASGINTFQVIDESGKDLIKYTLDALGSTIIQDHGIRLIFNRTNELSPL
jgi:hypothetical protein